jgi:TatD DNase family protein
MRYLNIHTHRATGNSGLTEIESLYYPQVPSGLAAFTSAGLHPWYLKNLDWTAAGEWLDAWAERPDCVAIGETGLDKVCDTPWALQLRAFSICIDAATERGKPLLLHCVRAYNELLAELPKKGLACIFHGFDKKNHVAEMLLNAGCYLSFGAALLREQSSAAISLKTAPIDRIFLETDDQGIGIAEVYEKAAAIKECRVAELAAQVLLNALNVGLKI